MSTTLTNGRILPQAGDKGNVWFPALENNIALDDAHTHDGVTSNKIPPASFDYKEFAIADGDFAVQANGWYQATVNVSTANIDPRVVNVLFYFNTSGEVLAPHWERVSATQIMVELPNLPNILSGSANDLRMVLR